MDSGPCGNYCNGVFVHYHKNPTQNNKKYSTASSSFTSLISSLRVVNENKDDKIKKHFSYSRYLLRKKGYCLQKQNCST